MYGIIWLVAWVDGEALPTVLVDGLPFVDELELAAFKLTELT